MFIRLYTWLFTLLWFCEVTAQQSIVGTVKDAVSGDPIAGASVFINTTTYGSSSSSSGDFSIAGVPVGTYEIVVSAMGYHTYVAAVNQDGKQRINLQIMLEVKQAMLEEVEIIPFEKDGWERWGKFFLETFVGTSPNALRTKLVNHEVIRFRHHKEEGYLEVVALEPLKIENKSLGYTLEYLLEDCRIDFKNKMYLLSGFPHFQELEVGSARKRRFASRRAKTYTTSLMRFIRSLYQETLDDDGYQVRRMERKPNEEKIRVRELQRKLYQTTWDSTRQVSVTRITETPRYTADSLAYFEKVAKEPDEIVTIFPQLLTADNLLVDTPGGRKKLAFADFLHVQNIHATEHPAYLTYMNEARKPGVQTSMLFLVDAEYVEMEPNGGYFPPQALVTSWYWAWCDKLADLLPLDYTPPDNE